MQKFKIQLALELLIVIVMWGQINIHIQNFNLSHNVQKLTFLQKSCQIAHCAKTQLTLELLAAR